jgi:putative flippase GtrA
VHLPTFSRSAVIGFFATAADLGSLVLLVQLLGLPPVAANVPALLAGVAVQFLGNKLFAFRDRSRDYLRQGALFALIEVGALLLNALAFHVFVVATPVPYWLARVTTSSLVYVGYSYPLWGRVFRRDAS